VHKVVNLIADAFTDQCSNIAQHSSNPPLQRQCIHKACCASLMTFTLYDSHPYIHYRLLLCNFIQHSEHTGGTLYIWTSRLQAEQKLTQLTHSQSSCYTPQFHTSLPPFRLNIVLAFSLSSISCSRNAATIATKVCSHKQSRSV